MQYAPDCHVNRACLLRKSAFEILFPLITLMLDTTLSHGQSWQVENIKEMEAVESYVQLRPEKKSFYCYLDFIHTISKK